MTTAKQRIQRAVENAARRARAAGQSEADVQAAMTEAREIHSDPGYQAHINAMEAEQEKAEKLGATMDERRKWLDRRHREALQEEPYGPFTSKIPLEVLKNLTSQERDQLEAFELQAFHRHRPLAQARDEQRRAFIAVGGDAESFDSIWELGGKDAQAAELASGNIERFYQDDIF